jgi:hypothetical protein
MTDLKSRWSSVANQATWRARAGSFLAKLKATKLVWFPPKGGEIGQRSASSAKKTTKRATKKTAGTAKKTSGTAKKTARKAAKKSA